MTKQYQSKSVAQTKKIGVALARSARGGEVFLLIGDLGAGKTTLVQGAAAALGVKQNVTSPTFVLMKVYSVKKANNFVALSLPNGRPVMLRQAQHDKKMQLKKSLITSLVHIDAYRGMDLPSLEAIGVLEYLGRPDTISFVEWGEGLFGYLNEHKIKCYTVRIENVSEKERLIKVE